MAQCALLPAIALIVATTTLPPTAQQLADEQGRRQAIVHYRAGQEFMSAEKFDRAAEEFSKAIQYDGLFTLAHYSLGQAHMNRQRYASAIQAFRACIEAFRALFALAETNRFAVDKQREDEIREMRETIRRIQAQVRLGQKSELQLIQAEQQLRDLENQRSPLRGAFRPPAEVLLALGSAHFRNGDPEEAEVAWKNAIDANPKLGEAHNNLAVIYMQSERFDLAEQELKLAEKAGFRVNPQFKEDLGKRKAGR